MQLVTLRYCCLQEDKRDNVLVALYWGSVRAIIGGFRRILKRLKSGAFSCKLENAPLMGNAATLVVRGNVSLTINIALSERVTEFSAVVRMQ